MCTEKCPGLEWKVTSDDPSNSKGAISYHTIKLSNGHRISSSSITTEIKPCVNSGFLEKQRTIARKQPLGKAEAMLYRDIMCFTRGQSVSSMLYWRSLWGLANMTNSNSESEETFTMS